MRVLLDECVDWRLARDIVGHDVKTAHQMGWASIQNGQLLALAGANFDAFITVDRNLPSQQSLDSLPICIIILRGRTARLADLKLIVPALLEALKSAKPGNAVFVGGP